MIRFLPSKVTFTLGMAGVLLLGGCTLLGRPRFVNHAPPAAALADIAVFAEQGCPENDRYACRAGEPIYALGCTRIAPPDRYTTRLQPAHPLAWCIYEVFDSNDLLAEQWAEGGEFVRSSGLFPVRYRYLVWQDGAPALLRSPAEFQAFFAPIESEAEALSYAVAMTGLEARYGHARDSDLVYEVDEIEDSHVVAVDDGYEVHLFAEPEFGCGPFYTRAVVVHVGRDGSLDERFGERLYRNPEYDDLCVD